MEEQLKAELEIYFARINTVVYQVPRMKDKESQMRLTVMFNEIAESVNSAAFDLIKSNETAKGKR